MMIRDMDRIETKIWNPGMPPLVSSQILFAITLSVAPLDSKIQSPPFPRMVLYVIVLCEEERVTRKPIVPSTAELDENNRARSSKLRVAKKVNEVSE